MFKSRRTAGRAYGVSDVAVGRILRGLQTPTARLTTRCTPIDEMVKRIYAHLGDVRHRSGGVEYRVEQHLEHLGDRLQRLGLMGPFVTKNVTAEELRPRRRSPASPK